MHVDASLSNMSTYEASDSPWGYFNAHDTLGLGQEKLRVGCKEHALKEDHL
jgi:hypothetical protein